MRRKVFSMVLILSALVTGCGVKNELAPEPYTREKVLSNGWAEYAQFHFTSAKQYFDLAVQLDSRDAEGYYGLALTYASLGLKDFALSNAVISMFANYTPYVTEFYIDTLTSVPDTILNSVRVIFPNKVYEGYYIYHLPKLSRTLVKVGSFRVRDVPAQVVDFGENFIVAKYFHAVLFTNPDSVTSSNLPLAGDTIPYSMEVINVDSLPAIEWNSAVVVASMADLIEDYQRAIQYSYIAELAGRKNDLPDRVVKYFNEEDVVNIMLHSFYKNEQWYSLTNLMNELDTTGSWPYPTWGDNLKEDVRWAFSHVNEIKSRYFSIIGGGQ